jgi:phage gp36-like protein
MAFLNKTDFKAVCDPTTLDVINQTDDENLARAIGYATEEVSSYLRSRYNVTAAFNKEGSERNAQLVMIVCDVALYHLVAWLPKRIGFEIREIRYNNAIDWLKHVQAGKASPTCRRSPTRLARILATPCATAAGQKASISIKHSVNQLIS